MPRPLRTPTPSTIPASCPTCGGRRRLANPLWLRERRESLGVSLRRAADAAGISPQWLSLLERGEQPANLDILNWYRDELPLVDRDVEVEVDRDVEEKS